MISESVETTHSLQKTQMPLIGKLISIQIGQIQTFDDQSKQYHWTSAITKNRVCTSLEYNTLGLDGDEQADTKNHGGVDKAILAYPSEHYTQWKKLYHELDWSYGGFGKNFTVSGFCEHTVCIGDVFRIGDTLLQASEPRQSCYKLARRWQIKELPDVVIRNNWSGWYLRVLQPGVVSPGDEFIKIESGSEWTIADVSNIIRNVGDDFDRAEQLYLCETLSNFIRIFYAKQLISAIRENKGSKHHIFLLMLLTDVTHKHGYPVIFGVQEKPLDWLL